MLRVIPNKKELGLALKKDAKAVTEALEGLAEDDAECLRKTLESGQPGSVTVGDQKFEVGGGARGHVCLK